MSPAVKLVRDDLQKTLAPVAQRLAPLQKAAISISGAGFAGIWLTEALTCLNDQFGFKSKIHVRTLTGKLIRAFAPHLLTRQDVEFTIQDCRHSRFNDDTDYLIHCNSPLNPLLYQAQPTLTAELTADSLRSFFSAAAVLPNVKNILYLSSGSVYGAQPADVEKLSEDSFYPSNPSILANVYSESKRYAESLCSAYRNEARLPIVIGRPFAFVGPYQQSTIPWALHSFIDDALNKRPIRILGDGSSTRSYMYGADAAAWMLTLLANGKSGGVYNIGNPNSVNLLDAAQMVAKKFNHKADIVCLHQEAHLKKTRFVPATDKFQKEFQLEVMTATEDSIAKTIDWMLHVQRENGAGH